jgi:hypothetical protein
MFAIVSSGCQAVNTAKPSKPYGISRLKNSPKPEGEHFMKDFVEEQRVYRENNMSSSRVVASPNMSSTGTSRDAALRAKYGLPHPDIILQEDLKDVVRLYTQDALRLQQR